MNAIQLKTKKLKSKMYLAQTYRLRLINSLDSQKRQLKKLVFGAKFHMCLKGSIHIMNGMSALERLYCVAIECLK